MSRRLSEYEKAFLGEWRADSQLEKLTDRFIDPSDGKEFHEGMAAGLLLALELIKNAGGLNSISGQSINAVVQRCIKESR
jgi:hypothetical protein